VLFIAVMALSMMLLFGLVIKSVVAEMCYADIGMADPEL
jgi:hypothetical protein